MFMEVLNAAKDLGRVHEIASILVQCGFGDVVRRIGLGHALEKAGRSLHWKYAQETACLLPSQRARRVLERLGPTFIKLGQILATRVDLFPAEWIAEFELLQDCAPPLPFEQLRPQLEEDLGGTPDEIFAEFDTEPLAAASIAQVHRARLKDGTPVVVKIRRPGIKAVVEADLRLMERIAQVLTRDDPEAQRFRPKEIVHQFTLSLRRELDLAHECRSAVRVAKALDANDYIVVPKIYWEWTCERVNVQQYIEGIPGKNIAALDTDPAYDRALIASRGATAVMKTVLVDGFFHADPHQGNIFFLPDNKIALIDYGMVGHLTEERRFQVVELLHGMVERDSTAVCEVLMEWSHNSKVPSQRLVADICAFLDQYTGVPIGQLNMREMISDMMTVLRDNQLALPSDLSMMFKVFLTLDGFGRQLNPKFDLIAEARPFVRQALILRYAPNEVAKRGWRGLTGVMDLLVGLPKDFRRLLRAARHGALRIHIDIAELDRFGDRLDRAASRITVGMITAAFIIGTSIMISVTGDTEYLAISLLAGFGFSLAAVGGVWVLLSIWRGHR
ncbi:MAG: AarF/UbiB family protein [Gammaproteobacteria bacterium]|jgi:ubiquinone biosynthesis protein